MIDEQALRARMEASSTDELLAICTTDAGDYTAEALVLAREVLGSRGVDTAELAPSEPRPERPDHVRTGGTVVVLALFAAMIYAGLSTALPSWANIVIGAGISSALFVGVYSFWRWRR